MAELVALRFPNKVDAQIPSLWEIQKETEFAGGKAIQLQLPYPATDGTTHSANGVIVVRELPDGVGLDAFVETLLAQRRKSPGYVFVAKEQDGKEWQTLFWMGVTGDGTKYPALHRFGVHNGVGVEFMVNFPLIKDGEPRWIKQTVEEFNSVCRVLKIDKANECATEFAFASGALILRQVSAGKAQDKKLAAEKSPCEKAVSADKP